MVFDWDKAARLIVEKKAKNVSAGLQDDWEWTGGWILLDGEIPTDSDTYLASVFAIPEIQIEDEEPIPCWKFQQDTPGWDSKTFWPSSALKILKEVSK